MSTKRPLAQAKNILIQTMQYGFFRAYLLQDIIPMLEGHMEWLTNTPCLAKSAGFCVLYAVSAETGPLNYKKRRNCYVRL
jgi:hypothetical protein